MQENTLQLIHFLLRDGEHLPRKSIVLFVVSRLEKFPSASKTNVGHVVQLLYRASCFNVSYIIPRYQLVSIGTVLCV